MKFNRDKFFDAYRSEFGSVTEDQVRGLERLLWGFETYFGWWDSIPKIANALAQIKHETANSFNPVVEGYYFGDPNKPGYFQGNTTKVKNFQKTLRYYPYFGMGDIQLTWKENFDKMDSLIRKYFPELVEDYNARTGKTFSLIKSPTQVLDGKISFAVFTIGMIKGTFTNKSLSDYERGDKLDHYNARSVVNGDKSKRNKQGVRIGDMIARYAGKFETILSAALEKDELVAEPVPVEATEGGFLDNFIDRNVSVTPDDVKTHGRSALGIIGRPAAALFTALEAGNIYAWLGVAVLVLFIGLEIYIWRKELKSAFDKLKAKLIK